MIALVGRHTFNTDNLAYSNDDPELDTIVVYLNTQNRHVQKCLTFYGEDRAEYLAIVSRLSARKLDN